MKGIGVGTVVEAWHGTLSGYNYRGCRCEECRAAHSTYRSTYRVANAERLRSREAAYRTAHPEQARASQAAYRAANPGKKQAGVAAWRAANPDKVRDGKTAYRTANRERVRAMDRAWRAANPEKVRALYLARRDRRYGLTPGQYDAMLAEQGNRCAICDEGFGDQTPHIDHDHSCCPSGQSCGDCIRSLLCSSCNNGLGRFQDNPERLLAAADYLNRFLKL